MDKYLFITLLSGFSLFCFYCYDITSNKNIKESIKLDDINLKENINNVVKEVKEEVKELKEEVKEEIKEVKEDIKIKEVNEDIKIKEEDKIVIKPILRKLNFIGGDINKNVTFKNDKKLVIYKKPKPIYKYYLKSDWELI